MEHGQIIHLKKPSQQVHTPVPAPLPPQLKKRLGRRWRTAVLLASIFVAGAATGLVLKPAHSVPAPAQTYAPPAGTKPAPNTQTDIVKAVASLIQMPSEAPSLATVTDLAPLKDQEFFADAAIGDVLLLFPQSRRAMLYRPSENKLIQVAPLTLSQ
jgi:hypothetical protein